MDAYETLGIPAGSDQNVIKRAYFRLLRSHSPETDPEGFSRIREAYETLKDRNEEEDSPEFAIPKNSVAQRFCGEIEGYRKSGRINLAKEAAEKALLFFPETPYFLYLAALLQRECGNSGKAWKNAGKLVDMEPENRWFWRERALSGYERGFYKKAFPAFGKAYELGCRDLEFIISYSWACSRSGDLDIVPEILLPFTKDGYRWKKEDIPEAIEVYAGLGSTTRDAAVRKEVIVSFCRFVDRFRLDLTEEHEAVIFVASQLLTGADSETCRTVIRTIQPVVDHIEDPYLKELAGKLLLTLYLQRMHDDPRLCRSLRYRYETFIMGDCPRFIDTDTKLCMLEEREEVLAVEDVLKEEYPDFHEEIKPFLNRIRGEGDASGLRYRLLQDYRKLAENFSGGQYLEWFPERREDVFGKRIVRPQVSVNKQKKIGRNDPCPCGSGRKYKQCCGR